MGARGLLAIAVESQVCCKGLCGFNSALCVNAGGCSFEGGVGEGKSRLRRRREGLQNKLHVLGSHVWRSQQQALPPERRRPRPTAPAAACPAACRLHLCRPTC